MPIVRELVLAVSLDPSMKAAIEHRYVQLVKQSDSHNGYQIDVEYLVADKANLTVYYRIHGLPEEIENQYPYQTIFELLDETGRQAGDYSAVWDQAWEKDALSCAKFHFLTILCRSRCAGGGYSGGMKKRCPAGTAAKWHL